MKKQAHSMQRSSDSTQLVGIDLFAGAGGMSQGATHAGVNVLSAIELEPNAARTYAENHPYTKMINTDVRSLDKDEIRKLAPSKTELILFGGPPCQGFSYSNPRYRIKENVTNWLCFEFLRYVDILDPRWIVIENVPGLRNTAQGFFLESLNTELKQRQFKVRECVLNAADFGVPQKRNRCFLVAKRTKKIFTISLSDLEDTPTVRDAIRDLPLLTNGNQTSCLPYGSLKPSPYAESLRNGGRFCLNNLVTKNNDLVLERYKHIPQGGNWENIPISLMQNYNDSSRCHTGIYHRLVWDKPSIVLGNYRKNMLIHPSQHRGLSVREAARIQSFPDRYIFYGSIGFQQQQVANAVPPILAEAVFNAILQNEN